MVYVYKKKKKEEKSCIDVNIPIFVKIKSYQCTLLRGRRLQKQRPGGKFELV